MFNWLKRRGKMMELRDGARIACSIKGTKITDARLSKDDGGSWFICQNEKAGIIADDMKGYSCSWSIREGTKSSLKSNNVTNLHLSASTDIRDLYVGANVLSHDGNEREVLGICGRVIFTSCEEDVNRVTCPATLEALIKDGYTLVPEVAPEVKEVTMADVCAMYGEDVKIKKEGE